MRPFLKQFQTAKHILALFFQFPLPVTDTRPGSTRAAFPLLRTGLRNPKFLEPLHVVFRVETHLFHAARVNHKTHTVNGDGRFGDIGWDDALADAFWCNVKDLFIKTENHCTVHPFQMCHFCKHNSYWYFYLWKSSGVRNGGKSRRTLSCSARDNELCKERTIHALVFSAYTAAASDSVVISLIPLRNTSTSPRSFAGY